MTAGTLGLPAPGRRVESGEASTLAKPRRGSSPAYWARMGTSACDAEGRKPANASWTGSETQATIALALAITVTPSAAARASSMP
jgi:hypothetical protein